ncbi:hypothetical protein [Pedobacter agri]|uniref:hypothetical protein n=1 Tax=Pedobacter agri TaxID=454586 RepID=UPI00292F8669|nr:hypothetical protein [Pedobacter agri]
MADWEIDFDTQRMDPDFFSIRSMFLSGSISKMYQLVKHSPTKISKLLGLNYDAYHTKLTNPEKFNVLHINLLAYAIQIDPVIISNIIQEEIKNKTLEKYNHYIKTKNK